VLGTFRAVDPSARLPFADVTFLHWRDRACLRLLRRYHVATTAQLVALVYRRRNKAQVRLQRLYRYGLLDRTTLPPIDRGGAPHVFRLSRRARARLGYPSLTRSDAGTQLRHDLNVVDAVVALAGPRGDLRPVSAWLSPAMSAELLDRIRPDALLGIDTPSGSGVVALEIDEATEHAPVISGKLLNYGWALRGKAGWHLLFVVPHPSRLGWLRRRVADTRGRSPGLAGRGWAVALADLRAGGLDAEVTPLEGEADGLGLWEVLDDPQPRRSATPVGSDAWLRLLAFGGGEDLDRVLR
jgi:hypothetical protein